MKNNSTSHNDKLSIEQANVQLKKEGVTEFPIEIFSPFIQDIILELHDNANYNIDYTAGAIFTSFSGTIGNTFHLKRNMEWVETPSIWITLVGKSGQNKSAPIKTAFKAMGKMQNVFNDEDERALENFKPESGGTKPIQRKLYSTDPTFESLIKMHKQNPNGLVLKPDEFNSFINNLIGYSGKSNQSNYLSIWDGSPISHDRKGSESYSVAKPCVSIIGGIQDDVLASLKAKDINDGFFERILFVIPKRMEKRFIKKTILNERLIEEFHSTMESFLNNIQNRTETSLIDLSPEANDLFIIELNKHVEASNKDNTVSGILSKLDRYLLRFSLIIEVSDRLLCNEEVESISAESMRKAILLKDYFYNNALKLNSMVLDVYESHSKEGKVLRILKAIGKREFSNKEFVSMANQLGLAKESYAYRLLNETKLVNKKSRGAYETDIVF